MRRPTKGTRSSPSPGWDGPLPSRHFSGYLQASPTKRLHYYLVQSEGDWNKDPVVLWFNGGPGCSKLGRLPLRARSLPRAVRRQGSDTRPLRLRLVQARDDGLYRSAVRRRVLVFYSKGPRRDYNATDDTAALDNLAAVESLFDKFPKLKSRDLYITGESYAGIYVPTLAEAIVAKGRLHGRHAQRHRRRQRLLGLRGRDLRLREKHAGLLLHHQIPAVGGFAPESMKDDLNRACAADFSTWAKAVPSRTAAH